jgi:general stress protein 26
MEQATPLAPIHAAVQTAPISILITNGLDGFPAARPMGTLCVEEDFTVYYATVASMDKCAQIRADPKAAVYWPNLGESGYGWVLLKGQAELTTEPAVLDRFWKEEYVRYFPQGRDDPSYIIIRIRPHALTALTGGMDDPPQTLPLE